MRIATDLTSLNDNFTGLERYAYEISYGMIKAHPESTFILLFKGKVPGICEELKNFPNTEIKLISRKGKLITNQLILPAEMKKIQADAYVFPAFPVPLMFSRRNTYALIADTVCFDMGDTMKTKARLYWSAGLKHSARVSRGIFVISEFTLSRVKTYFPKAADRTILAYCGINAGRFRAETEGRMEEVRKKYKLPEKYNLSLCTIEPRKNLKLLLDAYVLLKKEGKNVPPLVLSGRAGWKYAGWFDEAKEVLKEELIVTGFVEDADLPYVYRGAEAFVFPTLYEGFGMPPLEAFAAGCKKVLVSDIDVMKEVMGDTAFYFRSNDIADLKRALNETAGAEVPAREAVFENIQRFSWQESAEKIYGMISGGKITD
ncbi:MAG: glycosyltransferase family 4 protein [Lachnospiraceae bacterium]|nr:glycosyltransferase family 4 protein [Lachnospiraceae bacterium]